MKCCTTAQIEAAERHWLQVECINTDDQDVWAPEVCAPALEPRLLWLRLLWYQPNFKGFRVHTVRASGA